MQVPGKVNGWHTSTGGLNNCSEDWRGLGQIYEMLVENDVEPVDKRSDAAAMDLVIALGKHPGKKGYPIFRRSLDNVPGDPCPSGNPDIPEYGALVVDSAKRHWEYHERNFPPELKDHLGIMWWETINEPAQHFDFTDWEDYQEQFAYGLEHREVYVDIPGHGWLRVIDDPPPNYDGWRVRVTNAEWLGAFCQETARLAKVDGYKWMGPSWSPGEPEPEYWTGPEMQKWLQMCADEPEWFGVATHEYGLHPDHIWTNKIDGRYVPVPFEECTFHLIGRFQDILNVQRGVNIFITEWGWTLKQIPQSVDTMIAQCDEVNRFYAQFPEVKGCAIWALNPGAQWGNIAKQVQKTICPYGDFLKEARYEGGDMPPIPPDPEDCPGQAREPYNRVYWVVDAGIDPDTIDVIYELARTEFRTIGPSFDDGGIGDGLESKTAVLWEIPENRYKEYTDWYDEYYPGTVIEFRSTTPVDPPDPDNPLDGLKMGAPFCHPFVLTSPFNSPRDYGNKLHEGADYAMTNQPADSKEPVLNLYPGTVSRVVHNPSSGYYNYVVIEHIYKGTQFFTWHCHLDKMYVEVGQQLAQGDMVGEVGSTGQSTGEHDHINLQVPGHGLPGYVVSDVVDPAPYISMVPETCGPIDPDYVYRGPAVAYADMLHGPADDWRWPEVKGTIDQVGISVKFMSNGSNADYFSEYLSKPVHLVRLMATFNEYITPETLYNDTWKGEIERFYNRGARDFEFGNENNLTSEGLGIVWDDGQDFGEYMVPVCQWIKRDFPQARLWYPGMSPGATWTDQYIFTNLAWPILKPHCYGFCQHAYSGNNSSTQTAIDEIVEQIREGQAYLNLQVPMIVSECSVNRGCDYLQKANVYMGVNAKLDNIPGIQGCAWFISDWANPPPEQQDHCETWHGTPLPDTYVRWNA